MADEPNFDYANNIPHFLEEFYHARNKNFTCTFIVEGQVFNNILCAFDYSQAIIIFILISLKSKFTGFVF